MRFAGCAALSLFLAAALTGPASAAEPGMAGAPLTRTEAVRIAIQQLLAAKFTTATKTKLSEQGALVEFYAAPEQRPLWVDENGLTERGKAIVAEIEAADDYGLRARDYALPAPDSFAPASSNATEWLADAEIKISYAVLGYARDARGGRIVPERVSPNLDPSLALPNPSEVIDSIAIRADPAAYLRSFQPDHPQFEALRQKLLELRGRKAETPNHALEIPDGPILRIGVEHEQVALLRQRLEIPAEGPDGAPVIATNFDEQVAESVRRFQLAHGALPDGVVGPGTRQLLNGGPSPATGNSAQIRTILVNMERWRWLPRDLGAFYVTVNIPEFMLRVAGDGGSVYATRVVVGKPNTPTPVLSNEMQTVVFGPYWHVPTSIKVDEIRPYLREEASWFFRSSRWNTSVLKRHGLGIRYGGREVDPDSVDWNQVDIRTLELYQPPGPDNVLGRVKFVFPNKHDVYMHDTQQKNLFAAPVRAESHGCMRVQNPGELAAIIMKHDQGWSEGRTFTAFETGYDQQIGLKQRIPVHVTYFTLKVNDDGSLSTYGDIYGHDPRMAAALGL
ncbi:MAG: murein L,D-transpeptidase [Methyloceanibacter sp.]